MSRPSVARSGVIVLIAVTVGLWLTAAPVAADHGDGGLGFHADEDSVQVGGENGLQIEADANNVGSIDGGSGGGGVQIDAGGPDGFGGGGNGGASVGTGGVAVNSNGGGGTNDGNIANNYVVELSADNAGNVEGLVIASGSALGQSQSFSCYFTDAGPQAGDCAQGDGGTNPIGDFPPSGTNPIGDFPPSGTNPIGDFPPSGTNPIGDFPPSGTNPLAL